MADSDFSLEKIQMQTKGVIFDIKKYALHDGPGIRTTIFFKGCPLICWWCHNPEGQKPETEPFYKEKHKQNFQLTSRKKVIGREVTVLDVWLEIEKDRLFYDESGGGVTFSGGEPLMQPDFLNHLLNICQEYEIPTALDTCGYTSWKTMEMVKNKIDLFLYDIKIIDNNEHQKYTGVSNTSILSNLKKLDKEGKEIILRFPIIPGITDTEKNIHQLAEWMLTLETVRKISLLPYHQIGKGKYEKLNRINPLVNLKPPSTERMNALKDKFRDLGFEVKIGG